jgi:hypothetical protein
MDDADRYRCRCIYLKQSDKPAFQAEAACDALSNIEGILLAAPLDTHCIHIIYSLDQLSFEIIVELLDELEFETDKSLLQAVRDTIFCFLEDNARDNMQVDATELPANENQIPESPPLQDNDKYWDDYR